MTDESPRFVSFGEALIDFIRTGPDHWVSRPGGASWNVARVIAALGIDCAFAGGVSTDFFGEQIATLSADAGLDTRFLQRVSIPTLLAMVYEKDPPAYLFMGEHTADLHFESVRLPDGWLDKIEWVHVGGIGLAREPLGAELLSLLPTVKRAGKRVSFDANYRTVMGAAYRETFEYVARFAEVIKLSSDDLQGLYPGRDSSSAVAAIRGINGRALILLTTGAAGAHLYADDVECSMPAPAVRVADTVGAGDASVGGLLCSLMQRPQAPLHMHLGFAIAAGSAACVQAGATPPSMTLVEQLYEPLLAQYRS